MNTPAGIKILGIVSPSMRQLAQPQNDDLPIHHAVPAGAILGLIGVAGWKQHRVLGFLAGESLGQNIPRLIRNEPGDLPRALCNIGMTAAGVAGSLLWKKHPFYGYVAGFTLGAAATALVPGSNAYEILRSKGG